MHFKNLKMLFLVLQVVLLKYKKQYKFFDAPLPLNTVSEFTYSENCSSYHM